MNSNQLWTNWERNHTLFLGLISAMWIGWFAIYLFLTSNDYGGYAFLLTGVILASAAVMLVLIQSVIEKTNRGEAE